MGSAALWRTFWATGPSKLQARYTKVLSTQKISSSRRSRAKLWSLCTYEQNEEESLKKTLKKTRK